MAWHLRSQPSVDEHSRLVVLRRPEGPKFLGLSLIEMLLASREPEHTRWPLAGRVLIVDREALNRQWFVSMLESVGAGCYAAETPAKALRLLQEDEGLGFVLLGSETPEHPLSSTVAAFRAARPGVVIVGTGDTHRGAEFTAAGAEHFLQNPWRIDALIDLLTGRIGNCTECQLPLPLRRPAQGERAENWVCCNCGTRYHAVLDDEPSPGISRNVRLA